MLHRLLLCALVLNGPLPVSADTVKSVPFQSRSDTSGVLFERLPVQHSGVDFQPKWERPEAHIRQMLLINPVGGVAAGDVDGDQLPDLYITSPSGGNRLYRNLGDFRFEDITKAAGVQDPEFWGTGASFVDIDNDGDLDLFACGYTRTNKLYINQGNGRFVDQAAAYGLDSNRASMMMSFADMDRDGDLDGYLATTGKAPPEGTQFRVNMVKQKNGVEKPVVREEVNEYWGLIYLPGDRATRVENGQRDHLFRNEGPGKAFSDVTKDAGIRGEHFSLAATWWDYDDDGLADVYVSNDFTGPDILYRNRGDGSFENVTREAMANTPWFSMGSDLGDLNNDGRLDFMATDMAATTHYRDKISMGNMDSMAWFLDWAEPRQFMRNAVYLGTGTKRVLEGAYLLGLASTDWTWSTRLEDYDSDGRVDVFATNGVIRDTMNSDLTQAVDQRFKPGSKEWAAFWASQPLRKEDNLAFRNEGDLKFRPVSQEWGLKRNGVSFGTATADFDGDGDLDLAVSNMDAPVSLYRNHSTNRQIKIRLVGTSSNRYGIGAKVRIESQNAGIQSRFLTLARGWLSSSEPVLHFGLGQDETVDSIEIRWPSGSIQSLRDLKADRFYTIHEEAIPKEVTATTPMFVPQSGLTGIRHVEKAIDDFKLQPLLPNKLSQLGPGLAVGDVDGDGNEDLFMGGARGQAGQLYLSETGGRFTPSKQPALEADLNHEDMGAIFFDGDNDGDVDLYVVSGGIEIDAKGTLLRDRLYLNTAGRFQKASEAALPDIRTSGGPVAAADYDRDGDLDLFVGGRLVPGQYPSPKCGHALLDNQGDGTFKLANVPVLAGLGMVTSALWSDADHDGQLDLFLTTDWGPVRCLRFVDGAWQDDTMKAGLGSRLGWWNGIDGGDLDNDGDMDYVVTNFGLNTKYKATPEHPELLYYGDFAETGRFHIVEAKFERAKLLPRRGFSCSRQAMPFLGDKLKTYHGFASSTLAEVYAPEKLQQALKLEANCLESGVLLNDGKGRFEFKPLPRLAQISPAFGIALTDVDGDGNLDAYLAQNFFTPQRETGRMAGGLSQLLLGRGDGSFEPVPVAASGLQVSGDAKSLARMDFNQDGHADFVVGRNDDTMLAFARSGSGSTSPLVLSLVEGRGKMPSVGTVVTCHWKEGRQQVHEIRAGGGYLSQSSAKILLAGERPERLHIRWANGREASVNVPVKKPFLTLTMP